MEVPLAPAHRGPILWKELLLAVSLLTLWSPPTTAQLTIPSVNATEGKDVLLLVHSLPENLFGYIWYRGERVDGNHRIASYVIETQNTTPGPAHSGREKIYLNGSLLFQNVTLKDTGYYTVQAIRKDLQNKEATGQLRVYPELPKPSITSNNSNPEEHKASVLLTCEPHTQDTTYLWLINRQSLQDSTRLELSKDNRTLTLLHVTRNDTGPYECETRNPVSAGRSDPFTLNVLYGPMPPTFPPRTPITHQGQTTDSPATQPLTHLHSILGLSVGDPGNPHRSSLSPASLPVTVGPTPASPITVTGLSRTTLRTITVTGPAAPEHRRVRPSQSESSFPHPLHYDLGISKGYYWDADPGAVGVEPEPENQPWIKKIFRDWDRGRGSSPFLKTWLPPLTQMDQGKGSHLQKK
ncbi:cell adhesion molecule CEACAM7-like isoform 2-T2 [Glossophaga mutica]